MDIFNLDLERTRVEAFRRGVLYRTQKMLHWLRRDQDVPVELGDALLASWVGLLRQEVIRCARRDERFLRDAREGLIALGLGEHLGPSGYSAETVHQQFSAELGLSQDNVRHLLGLLREKFYELGEERMAFEPVGWLIPAGRFGRNGEGASFHVRFWSDFLDPRVEAPRSLIEGVGFDEADAQQARGAGRFRR
ncbi:MAG: hypothetical protein JOZ02_24425 [Acidobacteria bacterium]|nr:hypothetical protein [Acidobacteriota bacterium]